MLKTQTSLSWNSSKNLLSGGGSRRSRSRFRITLYKILAFFKLFHLCEKETSVSRARESSSQSEGALFTSDSSTESSKSSSSKVKSFGSATSSTSTCGVIGAPILSLDEICKATEQFSNRNKIGEGGFSDVYRAKLHDGATVAVKRFRTVNGKAVSGEFMNEVQTLSKIEHINLVRLYGYVNDGDAPIIVVEYIGNGNLREHLDCIQGTGLQFNERLNIAIDVAHAITYLHMYTDPPIIHRDIKSSNILITEKFRAKVADFGLAKLTSGELDTTHVSTQIKGTTGYLDPEYLRSYHLTEKSDVFSFGVLLVELMSGRNPIEHGKPAAEKITVKWALERIKRGESLFVMDPILRRSPASIQANEKILLLASRCVARRRQSRPSMKECGEILWCVRREFKQHAESSLL